jgi:hypothetical protein
MSTPEYTGQWTPNSPSNEYNTLAFICQQLINKLATITLVQVQAVSNSGGVSAVGTVSVMPLVNQLAGDGTAVKHGTLVNVPYLRVQGGTDAVILDPKVGDIGMCAFCMRDISAVKQAKAQSNPGSFRKYDWADGLYLGGFLNAVPVQYVQFSAAGITVHSPTKVRIEAPVIELAADTSVTVTAPTITETADTSITINSPLNDIKGGGTKIDAKVFLTHMHGGVQSGGSNTGGVT